MTYVNPVDTFIHWEKTRPDKLFLRQPIEGKWKTWTFQQAGDEIRKVASALQSLKLSPKSNIAILSKNCAEWIIADLAIWMAGYVSVPIYPTLGAATIKQILEHSESKVLIIGKLDNFESQRDGIPASIQCISVTQYGHSPGQPWNDLVKNHQPLQNPYTWNPEELATIKYTSGTTGKPKGVMINFRAFTFVIQNALKGFGIPSQGQRFYSYLPLSHIAERMLVEMAGLYTGATLSF
ncbi:MAG: AMP-binding protein, partial [Flammeovirgaceae bacterium]|nr:AMP-binding protein [Flammeovirgaceae bacterium]